MNMLIDKPANVASESRSARASLIHQTKKKRVLFRFDEPQQEVSTPDLAIGKELCQQMNDCKSLSPSNENLTTKWVLSSENQLHRTIVPTDGEWQKVSSKLGGQQMRWLPKPIIALAIVYDGNKKLEAIFGIDKDDNQTQIWP